MLFTAGCVKASGVDSTTSITQDTIRALEIVFQPVPSNQNYAGLRNIILSTYIAAYIIFAESGGLPSRYIAKYIDSALSPRLDIWKTVHDSGDALFHSLIQEGSGSLPLLLLFPYQVVRLLSLLFPASSGILPAICTQDMNNNRMKIPPETIYQQTNSMTSTILLSLAKHHQEEPHSHILIPGLEGVPNIGQPLALVFYYLALGLSPSPSICNNMGIILSASTHTRTHSDNVTGSCTLTGSMLAKAYYEAGLRLDSEHPHLLTNLGSLLKDQGYLGISIQYAYSKLNKSSRSLSFVDIMRRQC